MRMWLWETRGVPSNVRVAMSGSSSKHNTLRFHWITLIAIIIITFVYFYFVFIFKMVDNYNKEPNETNHCYDVNEVEIVRLGCRALRVTKENCCSWSSGTSQCGYDQWMHHLMLGWLISGLLSRLVRSLAGYCIHVMSNLRAETDECD